MPSPSATDRPRGTALVTGGRRGIGRAICKAMALADFDVAVTDVVAPEEAEATLSDIAGAGRKGRYFRRDIAETVDNGAFVEAVERALGPIDCLVNNAGIQVAVRGDLLAVTEESFDRLIATNLRGTFFLTQAVARAMVARTKAPAQRSVITITSANAALVSPEKGPYCISKAGLSMASQQFAVRLAEAGIQVHEIRPGLIRTDMTASVDDTYSPLVESGAISPVRRWGAPEEIAQAVVTLATGALPFSTGDIFHVGGGMHIHRL